MAAGVMMTLSPVHLWYSVEARLYAPMLVAVLLMIELLHRFFEERSTRKLWIAYALSLLVAVALHYYLTVYVLVLAVVATVLSKRRGMRKVGRRLMMLHASVLACVGLFVIVKFSVYEFETSQGYLRELTFGELYRFAFQWCWTGNCLSTDVSGAGLRGGAWLLFQVIGVALFVFGLVRLRRDRSSYLFNCSTRCRHQFSNKFLANLRCMVLDCLAFVCTESQFPQHFAVSFSQFRRVTFDTTGCLT